jgi:hypothetical protein
MSVLDKLKGGDPRSLGRANEVVGDVIRDPAQLRPLLDGMLSSDPVVRLRSSSVVERISAKRPDLLQPFVRRLLDESSRIQQGDVQKQVAQVLPRIQLTEDQRRQAESILMSYLNGRSGLARAAATKALTDLALHDPTMRARIGPMLGGLAKTGSAAVAVKGRKLLERLANTGTAKR